MTAKLDTYIKKMPKNYYICEKRLWAGNKYVDINHIDNDLNNPLDYEKAFEKMLKKLNR